MSFFRLLTATPLLGLAITSFAQQNSFDVQLSLKKLDCATSKAEVQVQVRAKEGQSFDMGDANYRFEYNPLSIKNPQIVSQENFSNQAAQRNVNYGTQTLQGSRELADKGIVSLNTFYTGSNAGTQKVGSTWLSVATIGFDIANMRQPISLTWHDDKTFPISGMSQVEVTEKNDVSFEYALKTVNANGFFGNLMIAPTSYCKSSAPSVLAAPIHVQKNKAIDVNYPINDADENDAHTATVISVGYGQATPSVKDRKLSLNYTPTKDFVGQDEVVLEVKDRMGNADQVKIRVTVKENALVVYNGFSPNNDGKNDYLTIEGIEKYPNSTLSIYDMYGKELYRTTGYKNDWDGKTNEKMLPDGTFYYVIQNVDEETYTGYIQIVH